MSSISVYGYDPSMLAAIDDYHVKEDCIGEAVPSTSGVGSSLVNSPTSSSEPPKTRTPSRYGEKQSSTSTFLELPTEIRHEILSYVMPRTFYLHPGTDVWYRATSPVWATCRAVYNECMRMLYGDCTFDIVITYGSTIFSQKYVSSRQSYRGRTLIPGRKLDFPNSISEANRALMRKVRLSVIRPDGYGGFIHHDCSSPHAIALGLRTRIHGLCQIMQRSPEIRELYIDYYDSPGDDQIKNLVIMRMILQILYELKNTRTVKIWTNNPNGPKVAYISQLQDGLTHSCKEALA